MRHTLLTLLFTVLLLGPTARAADDDIKSILTKAIKAHGGEKAMAKYKATRSKAKGTIVIPGAGEVEFTQEVSLMFPDKFKETMDLTVGGNQIQVVTIVNGDKVSIEAGGKEVPLTDALKVTIKDAQHVMKASRLLSLLQDKGYELSNLGELEVAGKPTVGIRVSSKGKKDLSLYFDKKTGLLAKVERRAIEPTSGKEFTEERIVVEYNKPNKLGIPTPKKVLVKQDGKKFMEAEVTEHTQLEKIEASEFEK